MSTSKRTSSRSAPPPPAPGQNGGGRAAANSAPPAPEPQPTATIVAGGLEEFKSSLSALALKLRDEQIKAKVVYYGDAQETNEELDAITEAVIADLRAIQTVGAKVHSNKRPADVEKELSRNLRQFLDKLFSNRRKAFLTRKIEEIQRRITTLFFNSELYSKISAASPQESAVSWPDQAIYHVFKRHEAAILADLHLLKYTAPGVREEAVARLQRFEKELRMEFLSRTTPELEKLLRVFHDTLVVFFRQFRKDLSNFCPEVVSESCIGQTAPTGYKVPQESFKAFREAFDRRFLEGLVAQVQEPIVQQTRQTKDVLRDETLRFVADPRVFTEICSVVCDACYDYLHGEGYLDLPAGWRAHLDRVEP